MCWDDSLSWSRLWQLSYLGGSSYLRSLKMTCQKALSLLRILAHTSWGADRDTLLFHRTLVLPMLEYGCEIYSSAKENRPRILDSVHHAGVRCVTGPFRSPVNPSGAIWPKLLQHLMQTSCFLICVVIRPSCVVGSGYNAFPSLSPVSWSNRILIRPLLLLVPVSPNLLGFSLSILCRQYLFL